MLEILETFLNLKTVVVNLHNLGTGAAHVIGQDIPRLRSSATLGTTDDPEGQSVQPNGCVFLSQLLDLGFLATEFDIPPTLEPDVKGGSFCGQMGDDGFIAEAPVKDQLWPEAQSLCKVLQCVDGVTRKALLSSSSHLSPRSRCQRGLASPCAGICKA